LINESSKTYMQQYSKRILEKPLGV